MCKSHDNIPTPAWVTVTSVLTEVQQDGQPQLHPFHETQTGTAAREEMMGHLVLCLTKVSLHTLVCRLTQS